MRRGSLFWGTLILIAGVLLLVGNMFPNLFGSISVWDIIWPLTIVLAGAWLLMRPAMGRRSAETQTVNEPLNGVSDADIRLYHGAGRLSLRASGAPGVLLSGSCVGGVDVTNLRSGPSARLDLRSRAGQDWMDFPNFSGSNGYAWDLVVTPEIPVRLSLETGASESLLDLRELKITDLDVKTGASSTEVTLPAQAGLTRAKIAAGAASVKLTVPGGVAARIRVQSGLAGINIDSNRFPASAGGNESPDYDSAANKVDIFVETGVGSVEIR